MKLKNLFSKIKNFVINFFTKADKTTKKFISIGIKIVDAIKKFVDSDIADVITALIPGDLDNSLQLFLQKVTPSILINLRKWESIVGTEDENTKLKLIIDEIKNMNKVDRDGIKLEIATQINAAVLGFVDSTTESLPTSDIKIMTLTAYHHPEVLEDEKAA
jgi:hypothetical protein